MAKKRKMLRKTNYTYQVSSPQLKAVMKIDLSRFEKQFQKAQYELDSMIMTDMVPFMPMQTGTFINLTRARSAAIAGSGKVVAAAPPYGRFLYYGKTMVDESTDSTWARKGAKKVLVSQFAGRTNARENLDFSKAAHPGVVPEWFEEAKRRNRLEWLIKTKETAGGG